jgi:hypothetical protein
MIEMIEVDTNYWYYTLSAVPQTLAATIALAATFSVVKLDQLSKKIYDARVDLRRFMLLITSEVEGVEKEIHDIEPLQDKAFLALYERCFNTLKPRDNSLGVSNGIYVRLQREMSRIIKLEWHSGYPARSFRIYGFLKMKKDLFKLMLLARSESMRLMLLSLVFAVSNIVISLLVLPNYNYFNGSIKIVYAVVFLAALSVIITAWSVWRISRV